MITTTLSAAEHITKFINNRAKGLGIRLGVRTSGCSGMSYVLEFADTINEDDTVFKSNGVTIVVDQKSLLYIDGTEVNYEREGLNEGFKFRNPNVSKECGCGESFNI